LALLKSSYLAGSRVARALPDGLLEAGVHAGGSAWFTLSRGQHRAALQNYAAVLRRGPDDAEVRRVAVRAFRNYGRMLLDFTRIASLTRDDVRRLFTYDGTEHIDRALERGRGAILALPHMGSWDMAGAAAGVIGYDIHAVAETFPGSLNEAVVTGREFFGMKVIPLGRSAVPRLIQVLRANGVAALLTDIARGGGVEVEMFERRANLAAGPASLALRTGAALLPVGVWSTGSGTYHGHVEPELIHEASGNRKADIRALTQRLADCFERMIRAHPDQWYAFKPILQPI
jgi:KDO2-lipid IV(A) lauroyltransferase